MLPPAAPGLRIGLFGGSFNPCHAGHLMLAKTALKRLRLHQVWWLVSPGNPLKDHAGLASEATRILQCEALIGRDARMKVSGIEGKIGTHYSAQTLRYILKHRPSARFVWLMGADNLAGFHRWKDWQGITRAIPIAIIDRPGSTLRAASSRAARRFSRAFIDESDAGLLANLKPPALVFLHGRRVPLSSTALRAQVN